MLAIVIASAKMSKVRKCFKHSSDKKKNKQQTNTNFLNASESWDCSVTQALSKTERGSSPLPQVSCHMHFTTHLQNIWKRSSSCHTRKSIEIRYNFNKLEKAECWLVLVLWNCGGWGGGKNTRGVHTLSYILFPRVCEILKRNIRGILLRGLKHGGSWWWKEYEPLIHCPDSSLKRS